MKGYARGGIIPADKARELFAADADCAISFEFAEKLVKLANQGHRAKAREVAEVMMRIRERGMVTDGIIRDERGRNKTQLADHLFWALWYNGLDHDVEYLAYLLEDTPGWLERSDPRMHDAGESMELLWMILVQSFGDYGTSPRSGWVEDTRGAAEFLRSRIKRTWGEADG